MLFGKKAKHVCFELDVLPQRTLPQASELMLVFQGAAAQCSTYKKTTHNAKLQCLDQNYRLVVYVLPLL